MKGIFYLLAFCSFLFGCNSSEENQKHGRLLLHNVTLIDGNGGDPLQHVDILIEDDIIVDIGPNLDTIGVKVINAGGKTVMPALISTHVHIGTLKGTENKGEFYTQENILSQLKKYQDYGVLNIYSMGSDRPLIFENGLRDSSAAGLLPGARMHSAGYGFGTPGGPPPMEFAMDRVYRPMDAAQVKTQMDSVAKITSGIIKIWVDDMGGKYAKMDPGVYKAIIEEAHNYKLRVAAHVYYLADARRLIADGIDAFGHSIRDSVVDDNIVQQMKSGGIGYIPTLSLDKFTYAYGDIPEWIDDPFFRASLEPGVYEMIIAEKYRNNIKNAPAYKKNVKAFETALKNVKKLHDAGVLVALGTDSGAQAIRAQGFSEHLELELLVQAGLTPLQAITVATRNSARLLKIDDRFGTIEKGKVADLLIIEGNPSGNIQQSRNIVAVYKAGREVR